MVNSRELFLAMFDKDLGECSVDVGAGLDLVELRSQGDKRSWSGRDGGHKASQSEDLGEDHCAI